MVNYKDILSRIPTISEHAYQLDRFLDRNLLPQEDNIAFHVVKILVFKDSVDRHKWANELFAFISRFNGRKLKHSGKLPSYDLLHKNLYDGLFENSDVDGIYTCLVNMGQTEQVISTLSQADAKAMMTKIDRFYNELCLALADHKVSKEEFTRIVTNTIF